jgi:hypothetical protein
MIPMIPAMILLVYGGMLFGVVWMGNHGPQFITMSPPTPESAFPGIINDFLELGGLAELIGLLMMCGAIAAFMSTAQGATDRGFRGLN